MSDLWSAARCAALTLCLAAVASCTALAKSGPATAAWSRRYTAYLQTLPQMGQNVRVGGLAISVSSLYAGAYDQNGPAPSGDFWVLIGINATGNRGPSGTLPDTDFELCIAPFRGARRLGWWTDSLAESLTESNANYGFPHMTVGDFLNQGILVFVVPRRWSTIANYLVVRVRVGNRQKYISLLSAQKI